MTMPSREGSGMATGSAPNYSGTGATIGAVAGSFFGPIGMGVGGALGSTIGSMFGGKESSGNNLGARDNEYMDRVYPGTTPYERLTAGAAGQAASAGNAERLSSRALQQQREAMDKQLQMKQREIDNAQSIKEKELKTSIHNTSVTNQTMQKVAEINERASNYKTDVESGRIGILGSGFNAGKLVDWMKKISDGVVEQEDIDAYLQQAQKEKFDGKGETKGRKNQIIDNYLKTIMYPRGFNFGRGTQAF